MPSERFETIFRRDLDRLPGLAESELVPPARHRRLTINGVGALTAIAVLALVVGLSLQAVRDAQLAQSDGGAATASSYFIAVEPGAEAFASSTSLIAGDALTGSPSCPIGRGTVTLPGRFPGGLKYDTTEPMLGKSFRFRWFRGTTSELLMRPVSV